jgi:dienelactone hydrolase
MGRAHYSAVVPWLVAQGFVVAVPTRVGYGVSGGPDVEDSGDCNRKNYPPGYRASADQTLAVLQALQGRPEVQPGRSVVMGQSFGGATSVAVAARNPEGVVATINFAGGGGGNPETQPQRPCGTTQLERLFRDYGRTARLPMLWVYTENDQYFGPQHPRDWFAAFREAGGLGEFTQFPPHGDDGHSLFTRFPAVWQPRVAAFLRAQGFELP